MAKILVVDDELAIRIGLQYCLEEDNHEVVLARDATEAVTRLSADKFDLATVDLRMPDERGALDDDAGIRLVERMDQEYRDLPVIVISVRNDPEARQACNRLGNVKEYLRKDPPPNTLKEAVKKVLVAQSGRPLIRRQP